MTSDSERTSLKLFHPATASGARVGSMQLFLLGITIVIGGQYFSWNPGLVTSFYPFFVAVLWTAVGYLCLNLCLAEMTSSLPFSGGAYGFVRLCQGPLPGYLCGCAEAVENIFYVTSSIIPFGQIMGEICGTRHELEPVYWLLLFVVTFVLQFDEKKGFWLATSILGAMSLLIILLYFFATLSTVNFSYWAVGAYGQSEKNISTVFEVLPLATWFFIGVEEVPLAGASTINPKATLPWGLVSCILVLFCTSIMVLFNTCSNYPGTDSIANMDFPLAIGFSRGLGISRRQALILHLPAVFATAYGFIFASGKQLSSMAASGLLPEILARKSVYGMPYIAFSTCTLLSFGIALLVFYYDETLAKVIFRICALASYMVYIMIFVSYCTYRRRYTTLMGSCSFISPLHEYGAYVGILIFGVCAMSVICFGKDQSQIITVTFVVVYLILCTCLYFYIIKDKQKFSPGEQNIMFSAYVVNVNEIKQKKMRKGTMVAPSPRHSGHSSQGGGGKTGSSPRLLSSSRSKTSSKDDESPATSLSLRLQQLQVMHEVEDGSSSHNSASADDQHKQPDDNDDQGLQQNIALFSSSSSSLLQKATISGKYRNLSIIIEHSPHSPCNNDSEKIFQYNSQNNIQIAPVNNQQPNDDEFMKVEEVVDHPHEHNDSVDRDESLKPMNTMSMSSRSFRSSKVVPL